MRMPQRNRTTRLAQFGLPCVLLLPAAMTPVRADGLLEQMQNEVAAIAARTRRAVVTVEETTLKGTTYIRRLMRGDQIVSQGDRIFYTLPDSAEVQRQSAALQAAQARMNALTQQMQQRERKQGKTTPETRAIQREQTAQLQAELAARQAQLAEARSKATVQYQITRLARSGSGFCIGDGYVVTTADVLEGMANPTVVTDNGTQIKARLVGVDANTNVGLVQMMAQTDLPSLTLGDSSTVAPGHFALSVGNQGGQNNTVALMLVGGVRQQGMTAGSHYYPSMIQIAGTVGAGTSGAPLLNAKGEVIGIMAAATPITRPVLMVGEANGIRATSIPFARLLDSRTPLKIEYRTRSELKLPSMQKLQLQKRASTLKERAAQVQAQAAMAEAQRQQAEALTLAQRREVTARLIQERDNTVAPTVSSAGYAIPINELKAAIQSLKAHGTAQTGWIGIEMSDEVRTREQNNILTNDVTVKLRGVYMKSPADKAGLKPGDILLRAGGKPIRSQADIRDLSLRLRPGDTLELLIRRDNAEQIITLTIEARPTDPVVIRVESKVIKIISRESYKGDH